MTMMPFRSKIEVFLWILICLSLFDPCRGDDEDYLPNIRANRFPSVETRVKLYMSNWYTPPCEGDKDAYIKYSFNDTSDEWPTLWLEEYKNHPIVDQTTRMRNVESRIAADRIFFMDEETIVRCASADHNGKWGKRISVSFRHNSVFYCVDVQRSIFEALSHLRFLERRSSDEAPVPLPPPMLFQFGDSSEKQEGVPHLKKFRSSARTPQDVDVVTSDVCYSSTIFRQALRSSEGDHLFQPIVWKLNSKRHYETLATVHKFDTQWKYKKDKALFMGDLTGKRDLYNKNLSDEENCQNLIRCRFVYNYADSTLIDAYLTNTFDLVPDVVNGVALKTGRVGIDTLLKYKGLVMLEGNDVSSGLKWALFSKSVVLMPKPTMTSWCMEELLVPWVHYVPVDDDLGNVEERMQWIIDNDEKARKISERATLWMEDLVFHPDAAEDDQMIQEEILRRYEAHFLRIEE